MTIRNRTLLIVATTLVALVFIMVMLSQFILLDSYTRLERERVDQNLSRIENAVDAMFASLRTINRDWSYWDTSYNFGRGQDPEFVEREMLVDILANIGTDFVLVRDSQGDILAERAIERAEAALLDFPDDARALLTDARFLPAAMDETVEAIVSWRGQPLLVAATSLLTSGQEGPPSGTLIFVQQFDDARIADMAEALDLELVRILPDLSNAPAELSAEVLQTLDPTTGRLVRPLDGERVEGLLRIPDIDGETAFYVRLLMPRDIVQQGQNTVVLFTAVLLISGFVLWGAMLALLEINILRPLAQLNRQVGAVRADEMGARVAIQGEDEISQLAQSINGMLMRLDESRRATRASEERLRTVVDNAPVLIWLADRSETIIDLQGSSVQTLGLVPQQIIGQRVNTLSEVLGLEVSALRQAMQGQESSSATNLGETPLVTRYQPVRDGYGAVVAVIGVATDVSKSRQSADEIQNAFKALEQKNRQLERVQALIVSTLSQLEDALQRTAPRDEIRQYVRFARERLDDLA